MKTLPAKSGDDELLAVSSGFQSWLLENGCDLAFLSFEQRNFKCAYNA